jgi:hypothetical protein
MEIFLKMGMRANQFGRAGRIAEERGSSGKPNIGGTLNTTK